MLYNDHMAPLQVFYDGNCILCSKEISYYRKQKRADSIEWINIVDAQFKAEDYGLDPVRIHARFHAKKNNIIVEGVDAFLWIWQELQIFKPLQFFAQNSLSRPIMNLGYHIFVKIRPYLPRRKELQCDTDACTPK
jgi:predicted DCC family thiol-disulfide oxidoreductase YuxK